MEYLFVFSATPSPNGRGLFNLGPTFQTVRMFMVAAKLTVRQFDDARPFALGAASQVD